MSDVHDKIRIFVGDHVPAAEFADEDDLFGDGLVNSLFALELVMFLEQEFSFEVESDDLELENFCSVAAMARFVSRKHAVRAA
jgi:acyl carrier protein